MSTNNFYSPILQNESPFSSDEENISKEYISDSKFIEGLEKLGSYFHENKIPESTQISNQLSPFIVQSESENIQHFLSKSYSQQMYSDYTQQNNQITQLGIDQKQNFAISEEEAIQEENNISVFSQEQMEEEKNNYIQNEAYSPQNSHDRLSQNNQNIELETQEEKYGDQPQEKNICLNSNASPSSQQKFEDNDSHTNPFVNCSNKSDNENKLSLPQQKPIKKSKKMKGKPKSRDNCPKNCPFCKKDPKYYDINYPTHLCIKQLSKAQLKAYETIEGAYSLANTCKKCNVRYAHRSGLKNHVKKCHGTDQKSSDYQVLSDTKQGRKKKINCSIKSDNENKLSLSKQKPIKKSKKMKGKPKSRDNCPFCKKDPKYYDINYPTHLCIKQLSKAQLKAYETIEGAYSLANTCKKCNIRYAHRSGLKNHVKKCHGTDQKSSDYQVLSDTKQGRKPKHQSYPQQE